MMYYMCEITCIRFSTKIMNFSILYILMQNLSWLLTLGVTRTHTQPHSTKVKVVSLINYHVKFHWHFIKHIIQHSKMCHCRVNTVLYREVCVIVVGTQYCIDKLASLSWDHSIVSTSLYLVVGTQNCIEKLAALSWEYSIVSTSWRHCRGNKVLYWQVGVIVVGTLYCIDKLASLPWEHGIVSTSWRHCRGNTVLYRQVCVIVVGTRYCIDRFWACVQFLIVWCSDSRWHYDTVVTVAGTTTQ